MKFRVFATPLTVAGTDKGGEDLFIRFTAEIPERPDLTNLAFEIVLGEDEDWEGDRENDISYMTSLYNFEWSGSKSDLCRMVWPHLISEKNWSANLAGTEFRFLYDSFVDGNAD